MLIKHFVLGITFIMGCAASILVTRVLSHGTPTASSEESTSHPRLPKDSVFGEQNDEAEILRLRAEIKHRDLALSTLALSANESKTSESPQAAEASSASDQDPITLACDTLDERMLTAPRDAGKSAELNHAISTMLHASEISSKSIAATHCGSTLCKVVLRDATSTELEQTLRKVSENTPKLFGGVAVYDSNGDEKSLYFAKDGKDLLLTPIEEGGKVQRFVVPPQKGYNAAIAQPIATESSK
jgi:hypothetical protein